MVAQERLEAAHRSGHWVILNNVHLMPEWLKKVEKLIDEYAPHPDRMRTSACSCLLDPSNSIPIGILDRSIKLTSDPPQRFKANIKQAFCTFRAKSTKNWRAGLEAFCSLAYVISTQSC